MRSRSAVATSCRAALWAYSCLAIAVLVRAGDWPQILGPHRNGQADGETFQPWPEAGPAVLWSHTLGQGYAGPAVAGGRVVIFHRVGEAERLESLDVRSGRSLWSVEFPASYRGGIDPDLGPRCVPLIHLGRVYACGAAGDLHCVDLATGKHRWSRAAYTDFRGNEGYFGAGSSPIVVGDRLLVNVGGEAEAGIVAFSLEDGATLWKATSERASYASPVTAAVAGQPYVVFATRLTAVCLSPADGAVRFRLPFGQRGPTVNAATPLVFGQHLFFTANYGVGAKLIAIREQGFEPVWANDESLSSQYATPVWVDGCLYGIHGREDVGTPDLRCVDAATGKIHWSETGFGTAHIIAAGNRLLVFAVDGRLVLAEASPHGFQRLATATISQSVTRALPAVADGRLYFRENAKGTGTLRCLQLH